MPVCKFYSLFISADAALEKEKKEKKYCCPLGFQSLQPIQYLVGGNVDCNRLTTM
jgi:hypothetical protein